LLNGLDDHRLRRRLLPLRGLGRLPLRGLRSLLLGTVLRARMAGDEHGQHHSQNHGT
jgi:hypothetical protein